MLWRCFRKWFCLWDGKHVNKSSASEDKRTEFRFCKGHSNDGWSYSRLYILWILFIVYSFSGPLSFNRDIIQDYGISKIYQKWFVSKKLLTLSPPNATSFWKGFGSGKRILKDVCIFMTDFPCNSQLSVLSKTILRFENGLHCLQRISRSLSKMWTGCNYSEKGSLETLVEIMQQILLKNAWPAYMLPTFWMLL